LTNPSKDYYAALGVLPSIEGAAIRAVYLTLLKKYHPDVYKGANDEAIRRTKELNEAYSVLGDEKQREKYDSLRTNSPHGKQRPASRKHKAKASDFLHPSTAKRYDSQRKTGRLRELLIGIMGIVALVFILTVFGGTD
jgi:curved DNA-binding protein CbpA